MHASLKFVLGMVAVGALMTPVSLAVQRHEGKRRDEAAATAMTGGGDPRAGRDALKRYNCGACHAIKGSPRVDGQTGPALDGVASRAFIAGKLPNRPDAMMRWIRDPQPISPGGGMPNLGVTEKDGRDLAAYLYTLR